MVKKADVTKKKSHPVKNHRVRKTKETIHQKPIIRISSEAKIEKVLVENFVSLQKVMTNLSIKFDNLANQISKLLELFEISAKALAEKDFNQRGTKDDKKVIERLDNLADQNKVIARGLTLLHETPHRQVQNYPPVSTPKIPPQVSRPSQGQGINATGYQKSISLESQPETFPEPTNLKPTKFRQLPEQ